MTALDTTRLVSAERPHTAGSLACSDVVVVDADEAAVVAWNRLRLEGVARAVVLRSQVCIGVVELHDLWVSWALGLGGSRSVQHLVAPAPQLPAESTLQEVCRALDASAHGVLLVTGDDGRLLGTLCERDVVHAVAEGHRVSGCDRAAAGAHRTAE